MTLRETNQDGLGFYLEEANGFQGLVVSLILGLLSVRFARLALRSEFIGAWTLPLYLGMRTRSLRVGVRVRDA